MNIFYTMVTVEKVKGERSWVHFFRTPRILFIDILPGECYPLITLQIQVINLSRKETLNIITSEINSKYMSRKEVGPDQGLEQANNKLKRDPQKDPMRLEHWLRTYIDKCDNRVSKIRYNYNQRKFSTALEHQRVQQVYQVQGGLLADDFTAAYSPSISQGRVQNFQKILLMGPGGLLAVDFTALTSEDSPSDLNEVSLVVVGMGASDEREGKSMLAGDLRHPRKHRSTTKREGKSVLSLIDLGWWCNRWW
ncbi:hypothetical protein L2E82_34733 [Cichorium intybus]|uniref:Uncharacterized protein n=1 Tax=Cichorium intybus TaxID=13427 RepID=A0ACB9BMM7_CICIN|nr:hypothetical protein L2E82_34733 [Cichorium intybus]